MSVEFLGHIISGDGVATDPAKVKAVLEWAQPQSVTDVRSFLGTCSYYRSLSLVMLQSHCINSRRNTVSLRG